eukprot:CAMPEP_0185766288 /NCGR_PEP_ID=MMETSP1174-20130828/35823_1 /TAXON_ID=35687 /ORGANISM="Dictyocha speculum, Strain CCMP1381" /LENGTH=300 /DNA_ID=CAMNT_0028449875 /DNA_START=147 /DNA_END=1049 /DNA_ORIENTATION=-
MILTCAHDRNAFVWHFDEETGVWNPSLVILRIEHAAISCKWSPDGRKFAVSSGAKCVSVCHYEEENSWWVSKMIKKPHKSTVLCVAWHPNSQMLATGSSDFKCRWFSAYIPFEGDQGPDGEQEMGPLQEGDSMKPFAELYKDWGGNGWVHCAAWSPSGMALAFGAHDSSIHFVTFGGEKPVEQVIRFGFLPLCSLIFSTEDSLVGAGHDCNPALFENNGGWAFKDFLDKKSEVAEVKQATSGAASARAMFQNKAKTGQNKKEDNSNSWQKHLSPITCMQQLQSGGISTSALDGRLTVWTV